MDQNKENSFIAGAGFPSEGVRPVSASGSSSQNVERSYNQSQQQAYKTPSEEFRTFWGNHLSPGWFKHKKKISISYIIIALIALFTLYLCSNLLFSPAELFYFASDTDTSVIEQAEIDKILEDSRLKKAETN